jgi:AraC-like DNA-binding protein
MQLKEQDLQIAREIKAFLQKNYRDHYDYDFLSKKYLINKCKLKLAFREVAKDNIHVFITKVRIEHAMHLLKNSELTIGYIASKVGLEKSNLTIQFKKYTGQTPAQWRKNRYNEISLFSLNPEDEVIK